MSWNRITTIVLRQLYLIRGSFSRVFPLFAWIGVDMILWGFLSKYLTSVVGTGFNFVPALLGAMLLWDFFSRIMHGVTIAFFEDIWSRNFLNIFSTPLLISEYVMGLVLTSILTSVIGLIVMFVIAIACFKLSFISLGLLIVPFLLVLFLFGIALGIFGSALVLRWGPASEWFIWPIPAMISPVAGVLYPVNTLPPWMQVISHCLPPAYVFEGLRAALAGQSVSFATLGIAFILACTYIILAYKFFVAVYRSSLQSGLIARYSVESVS